MSGYYLWVSRPAKAAWDMQIKLLQQRDESKYFRQRNAHLNVTVPHLLSLLLDEEHQPELEEGVCLLVRALTGQLLVVGLVVAGPPLDHVDPRHLVPPHPPRHRDAPHHHHYHQCQQCPPHFVHTLDNVPCQSHTIYIFWVTFHDILAM